MFSYTHAFAASPLKRLCSLWRSSSGKLYPNRITLAWLIHKHWQLFEMNDQARKYDACTILRVEQIFKCILAVAAASCQRIKERLAETKRMEMSASLVGKFSFFPPNCMQESLEISMATVSRRIIRNVFNVPIKIFHFKTRTMIFQLWHALHQ